ncbi:MAG TPA: hypothetical protein VFC85_08520, partial [Verrucomicrobiae bacterium]|nr:hypothetical protein [Verrucomicrobiae bacterium]
MPWRIIFVLIFLSGNFFGSLRAGEPSIAPANAPQTRALIETDALALLTTALQKNYVKDKGELELNFTQPWSAPVLPDEPLAVKILELPSAGVTPSF